MTEAKGLCVGRAGCEDLDTGRSSKDGMAALFGVGPSAALSAFLARTRDFQLTVFVAKRSTWCPRDSFFGAVFFAEGARRFFGAGAAGAGLGADGTGVGASLGAGAGAGADAIFHRVACLPRRLSSRMCIQDGGNEPPNQTNRTRWHWEEARRGEGKVDEAQVAGPGVREKEKISLTDYKKKY